MARESWTRTAFGAALAFVVTVEAGLTAPEDEGVSKGVWGGGEGERAEESFKLSNGPLSAAAAPGGPAIPAA